MNDTQSTIIPIIGYIDATTPDLTVHSPILETWVGTGPALFRMGANGHVCTQAEMKQHVAQNLLALRQDLEQELDAGDEFYTMTPLKKGHFHRQDAKSAKIFKQDRRKIHLRRPIHKKYST